MSSIRDNHGRGKVGNFLREKITPESDLAFVSAYFTIGAYLRLKPQLESIRRIRFLFGEPSFLSGANASLARQSFQVGDDASLESVSQMLCQREEARLCAKWFEEKAEIRSVVEPNFLHGKLYHITHKSGSEEAIMGSSNFTANGLGFGNSPNIELNLIVQDKRDLDDLKRWFEMAWESPKCEDVKARVISRLNQLYRDNAPEFIYFKTLYCVFKDYLDETQEGETALDSSRLRDSQIWNALYDFQRDAAKAAINRLNRLGGCILADSVGLGKTFTTLAVIKHFENRNHRVLVLAPKRLLENWKVFQAASANKLNPFPKDRFSYAVLAHTDLLRDSGMSGGVDLSTVNWDMFDCIIIDESHNFRANSGERYQKLLQMMRQGARKKVMLLSATPVNNALKDLRNQISLMTAGDCEFFRESLGVKNYAQTLAIAQKEFVKWTKSTQREPKALFAQLGSDMFKLLDELSIARSRKHIQKYYNLSAIGEFPQRNKPISIFAPTDSGKDFPSYDEVSDEVDKYQLSIFNPSKYLKPEHREKYSGKIKAFTQTDRERFLIGMMKVNFLKRLESSVYSFRVTMERTMRNIESLQAKIKRYKEKLQDVAMEYGDLYAAETTLASEAIFTDEELQAFQAGAKLKFNFSELDVDKWLRDLEKDKAQLEYLAEKARQVSPARDAKLAELKRLIESKFERPTKTRDGRDNPKVLVFTAFADTARYLYEQLRSLAERHRKHIALVTGSGDNEATFGKTTFNDILLNFSPRSKRRAQFDSVDQTQEIDLLIATDCISEGQNLQDCDMVVNYDIHWNPVRLIQRFGRIDRIGSYNASVSMANFWATNDLDKYINLKSRVEARMALVDITATSDENFLAPDELQSLIQDDLNYRDKQLLRLKDEILDAEDVSESVSLAEFSLDAFRVELARFLESRRSDLESAPNGIFGVVPEAGNLATRGIIFCLKQKSPKKNADKINPLQPYFLVYVRDSGEVRFGFAQPKSILELYRLLCLGKRDPIEELCRAFDIETEQGKNMQAPSRLLKNALTHIQKAFSQQEMKRLQNDRDFTLSEESDMDEESRFELVTWLVIR